MQVGCVSSEDGENEEGEGEGEGGESDKEEDICPICLNELDEGEDLLICPGCNNRLHQHCMDICEDLYKYLMCEDEEIPVIRTHT